MNPQSQKQAVIRAFKAACLGADFKAALIAEGLCDQAMDAARAKYIPRADCRGCGLPITVDDFAVWTSYWWGYHFPSHTACREPGMKEEAYECQLIDADCNDCRHFRRQSGRHGTCDKTSLPVVANPVFYSGHTCFEHRKGTKQ